MNKQPLTEADLKLLSASFISCDLARSAGIFRVDSVNGAEMVGRNGNADYAGLAFPYYLPGNPNPREYRLRRDNPDLEQSSDGQIKQKRKYLSPPGVDVFTTRFRWRALAASHTRVKIRYLMPTFGVRAAIGFCSPIMELGRTIRHNSSSAALIAETKGHRLGAEFSRKKTVAGSRRGVVKFLGLRWRLRVMSVARSAFQRSVSRPNKPMHPTADTHHVINLRGAARRVIGGVGRLRVWGS